MLVRAATPADRNAVLSLGVAEEAAWFGEAENSADEVAAWIDDEGGMTHGLVTVDADGRVCGFASPGRRGESVLLAAPGVVEPVTEDLLPWLGQQRDVVELMTFGGDGPRIAAFERHGLRHLRSSFTLVRPGSAGPVPAAVFPPSVAVGPYHLGEDDEAVHRLIYVDAAWAAVPGHVERDLYEWRRKEQACRWMSLARREGRPIGWASARLTDAGRGEVRTLAVAVHERGRGLGRALLLRAFGQLQRAGARDITLGVEAENESALGLYRSVGLETEREWRVYTTAG